MNYLIANCKGCRHDSLTKPCAVRAKIARGGVPNALVRTSEEVKNIASGQVDPVVTCLDRSPPKEKIAKVAVAAPLPGQLEIFSPGT